MRANGTDGRRRRRASSTARRCEPSYNRSRKYRSEIAETMPLAETRQRGQDFPPDSNRWPFHNIRLATAIAARLARSRMLIARRLADGKHVTAARRRVLTSRCIAALLSRTIAPRRAGAKPIQPLGARSLSATGFGGDRVGESATRRAVGDAIVGTERTARSRRDRRRHHCEGTSSTPWDGGRLPLAIYFATVVCPDIACRA